MYNTAFAAFPLSYSKACDTSRPRNGPCATVRAGLGGEAFVNFDILSAMPNGLVRQHFSEGRPACIEHGLRQAGLGESTGIDIADSNVIEGFGDLHCSIMQEVHSAASRARVDGLDTPSFMRSLRHCQRRLGLSVKPRGRNLFAVRQCGKILQTQVNTDALFDRTQWWVSNLDHNIKEPVATAIAGKAGSVLNFSLRQRTRVEHAESIACEAKRTAFPMQVAPFQRNPTQGFATAISQQWSPVLRAGFRELFAGGINGTGMQPQFLAAASRQLVQVKSGQPWTAETQGIFLPVVAVIPDEVHRAAPLVKQSVQRLHAITAYGNHAVSLYSIFNLERTTPSESAPFTPRPEGRGFSEQI